MEKDNIEDAGVTSGENISYWTGVTSHKVQNPLKENLETNVVVVGGGFAGLSVAYCLSQSGKKENIECGFERINGYLFQHPSDKKDSLQHELKVALNAGIEIKEVDKALGLLHTEKALCFLNQAQFQPLIYLKWLMQGD